MIITGYQHRKGKNCESSVQQSVLAYFGANLDEEVIFGLDGSFGFMYFETAGNMPDTVVGKAEIFPGNAMRYLGVELEQQAMAEKAAWDFLRQYIRREVPVIARVDIGHLAYWALPKNVFYGGYFVVVIGFEDERHAVYLADSGFEEIVEAPWQEFSAARSSKNSYPINPNNLLYVLRSPRMQPDLGKIGPVALRTTTRNYLHPRIAGFGLPGLEKMPKIVSEWPGKKTGAIQSTLADGTTEQVDALRFQLLYFGRQIEEFGTGGAFFRSMFHDYLQALHEVTGQELFLRTAVLMEESADYWGKIGGALLQIAPSASSREMDELAAYTAETLAAIAKLERKAFGILRGV